MIKITAKLSGGGSGGGAFTGLRYLSGKAPFPLSFSQSQMQKGGEFAIATVKKRVSKGIGSDDAAMPALSGKQHAVKGTSGRGRDKFVRVAPGYAGWKSSHGLQPIRDMRGDGLEGGHALDNLSVRSVSSTQARIAFTQQKARNKMRWNEKRTPFCSFSDADRKAIVAFYAGMFGEAVKVVANQFKRIWRKR